MSHVSASFSATIRVRLADAPGAFARLAGAIGDAGGSLGAIDLVRVEKGIKIRDVTVDASDSEHLERIVQRVRGVEGIEVEHVSDRTFLMHLGGKIEMQSKVPVKTRDDLSMAYTPGVARICQAIAADRELAFNLTIKQNTVAVVSDGTAVLGLGDIGPEAAMPVMEGKALLFKEFGGVDAWPICLDTKDTDEIGAIVPGGAASGILPPDALDAQLTRDGLAPYGCGVGSAAVQVFPTSYPPLRLLAETMRFFAEESCQKCTPCRIGNRALEHLAERLQDGEAAMPRWQLDEWLVAMEKTSICGLGQASPIPVRCAMRIWPELFEKMTA